MKRARLECGMVSGGVQGMPTHQNTIAALSDTVQRYHTWCSCATNPSASSLPQTAPLPLLTHQTHAPTHLPLQVVREGGILPGT
jgi:hypothetical protein